MLQEVHKFRGVPCSYVLRCQAPDGETKVYCGSTCNLEQRFMDHGRGRAAKFTKACPPTGELLHIREHDTAREALMAEVALANLWMGKLGPEKLLPGVRPRDRSVRPHRK